ncbi:Hypothetical protein, putative [Bodo saltans]|uniref:Uncharacterized protein n=1 Tax=Bodo saltans TaxID=75058 RepID=A0A0S4JU84_BODSA|nr:Hypothetical protein, putative [Bodo saltans]|eukprot:CUG93966.1 Hypothetical protein, putative [Bodo saltans]
MDVMASHLFFGATTKTSFGRAWESLLASFPKRDVSLMSRLGIAATEAYLSAVGGALVVPGAITRLRFSLHQTDVDRSVMGVLPASSCADDVISLKHHVYAILLAHGCVSTLAECGALISTSAVLAGTFEATIVAEIAVAAVLCRADSAHVRVLRSSCSTNTTTVPIWDSLLASCSSQTKKVFDTVYSWEATKALLAKQDAEKAKLIAAGSIAPSSAASADPFPSFIEVERSAVEFMNAVLSFQQPSVDNNAGRITTWTRHTIANHFDGVLKILDSELLAFVVYLLLTRAPREVISWLLLFVERAAVVKDHHACLERMIVKLQQVTASQ